MLIEPNHQDQTTNPVIPQRAVLNYASAETRPRFVVVVRSVGCVLCALSIAIALLLWKVVLPKAFDGLFGVNVFFGGHPVLKAYNIVVPPWFIAPGATAFVLAFPLWFWQRANRFLRLEWEISLLSILLIIAPCIIW
jgi:hypothetical protein